MVLETAIFSRFCTNTQRSGAPGVRTLAHASFTTRQRFVMTLTGGEFTEQKGGNLTERQRNRTFLSLSGRNSARRAAGCRAAGVNLKPRGIGPQVDRREQGGANRLGNELSGSHPFVQKRSRFGLGSGPQAQTQLPAMNIDEVVSPSTGGRADLPSIGTVVETCTLSAEHENSSSNE